MPSVQTRNHARQRENGGDGMEGGSQSKPVAAAFAQARSRLVTRQLVPPEALSTSQISRDVLSVSGYSPSPDSDKKPGVKRKAAANEDLFSALSNAEPASVINFHERVTVKCVLLSNT